MSVYRSNAPLQGEHLGGWIWEDLEMAEKFEVYQTAARESETLGKYLNRVRELQSRADGLPYDEPIPWSDICAAINNTWAALHPGQNNDVLITPQSIGRWEKDQGRPSAFGQYQRLALWFGKEVYGYMFRDEGISPKLLFLVANGDDPNVAEIIDRAHDDAQEVMERQGRANRGRIGEQVYTT